MVLEATMIVVDNSERSRNGDYFPTRFEAQADAVNLIFTAKTGANPESSVGLLRMGGWNGPEVLSTLTTDMGKILDGIYRTKVFGVPHLMTAINTAALALKHRQNKSQRQRIIVFNCSIIEEDEKSLVKLAKRMKKSNISVDIIAFGELRDENLKKLEAFNVTIKGGNGSHLEIVPPGSNLLSDSIITTPILASENSLGVGAGVVGGLSGGMGGGLGGGSGMGGDDHMNDMGDTAGDDGVGSQFEFGVDPSMDPELAMALRMSYEEEKARQEREKADLAAKASGSDGDNSKEDVKGSGDNVESKSENAGGSENNKASSSQSAGKSEAEPSSGDAMALTDESNEKQKLLDKDGEPNQHESSEDTIRDGAKNKKDEDTSGTGSNQDDQSKMDIA